MNSVDRSGGPSALASLRLWRPAASGVPAPSASRRHRHHLFAGHSVKIVLTPAPLFWVMAEALVAQEEFLTWGQFQWHYRAQLASQL